MPPAVPWLQISLPVDRAMADAAVEEIEALGAAAVTMEDAADTAVLEPAPGETPLWPRVVISALFEAGTSGGLATLSGTRVWASRHGFQLSRLEDKAWEREWLKDFPAMRFGRRLWVCPGDREPPSDPSAVVLSLDPGLAFGTGTHPTTALCLEWLDLHPPVGKRVVDFGCGSGILGIAAAKLGASEVVAVDIDPQALSATRSNALRNEVVGRVRVTEASLTLPAADLLMANILAGPLIELAPAFCRVLSPGTTLVLSGILAEQVETVVRAYADIVEFSDRAERDGWVRLTGNRLETD